MVEKALHFKFSGRSPVAYALAAGGPPEPILDRLETLGVAILPVAPDGIRDGADFLRREHTAPRLIIGYRSGAAAALAAAGAISGIEAVAALEVPAPTPVVPAGGPALLLLDGMSDAECMAEVLATWTGRVLDLESAWPARQEHATVVVEEAGAPYTQRLRAGSHPLTADEPESIGGADRGPNPYELLLSSLGACTTITVRMYADRKRWPLESVGLRLRHAKIEASKWANCETRSGKIDSIECELDLRGELTPEQRRRLLEISSRCPVHKTLHSEVQITTRAVDSIRGQAAG